MLSSGYYRLYIFKRDEPVCKIGLEDIAPILTNEGFTFLDDHKMFTYLDTDDLYLLQAKLKRECVIFPHSGKADLYDFIDFGFHQGPVLDHNGFQNFIDLAFMLKYKTDLDIYDVQADVFINHHSIAAVKQCYHVFREYYYRVIELEYECRIGLSEIVRSKVDDNHPESQDSLGQFQCDFNLRISGEIKSNGENIIFIDEISIPLSDAPFKILLRLIIELNKGQNGFLHLIDLIQEGYLTEQGAYQGISRLKKPFRLRLDSLIDGFEINGLFERIPQHIRLSNNPEEIEVNKAKLLQHPNPAIVKLAEQFKA